MLGMFRNLIWVYFTKLDFFGSSNSHLGINNLSVKIQDGKVQFGTFESRSYEGNPFLCGPPLEKNCTTLSYLPSPTTSSSDETEGKWYDIDPVVFYASFVGTYITFLFGFATLLYINPY